jgi:hypothetical protein
LTTLYTHLLRFIPARNFFVAGCLLLLVFTGCTGLRHAGNGKLLYTGSTLKFDTANIVEHKLATRLELEELLPVKPNRKILWMRPGLCLFNMIPEPQNDTGFWHWVKYKLGEPPAWLIDLNLPNVPAAMENRLQNRGHFTAKVTFIFTAAKKRLVSDSTLPRDHLILFKKFNIPWLARALPVKYMNCKAVRLLSREIYMPSRIL